MRATPRAASIGCAGSLRGLFDPNDWRLVQDDSIGIRYLPLTTDGSRRVGTRERVLDVAGRRPSCLTIGHEHAGDAGAARRATSRAVGVEYRRGTRLYRAHARPGDGDGERGEVRASREVVLAGGAFNSPQLLMLSGIGPPDELQRVGIPVRVPLPGVGANLQDRYEVSVVSEMDFPEWDIYEGATFQPGDAAHQRWKSHRNGPLRHQRRGAHGVHALERRERCPICSAWGWSPASTATRPGTRRGWAWSANYLTWVILKAHTKNAAGRVTLRSADPRDMPVVNFRQFVDGGDDDRGRRDRRRALRPRAQRAAPRRRRRAARDPAGQPRAVRGRASRSRALQRVGAPRLRHVRDRRQLDRCGARQPVPGPRHTSACASSTPRFSREFQGFSSPARST